MILVPWNHCLVLDSVHQGVDKAFRWASITFCDTYNSQWASPTARCGLDRAARSVTVASRPLEVMGPMKHAAPLYDISDQPLPHPECRSIDGTSIFVKLLVTLKYPANRKITGWVRQGFPTICITLSVTGTERRIPYAFWENKRPKGLDYCAETARELRISGSQDTPDFPNLSVVGVANP